MVVLGVLAKGRSRSRYMVCTSLAWPDPWIGPRALIKGLVTLRYISCASTTIVV